MPYSFFLFFLSNTESKISLKCKNIICINGKCINLKFASLMYEIQLMKYIHVETNLLKICFMTQQRNHALTGINHKKSSYN